MSNTINGEYCLMRMLGSTLLVTHAQLELNIQVMPGHDRLKQELELLKDLRLLQPMQNYRVRWIRLHFLSVLH